MTLKDSAALLGELEEVYQHRAALFCALARFRLEEENDFICFKSRKHVGPTGGLEDVEDGYFLAYTLGPEGQISYHLKDEWWEKFPGTETETPSYDWHSSECVLNRLNNI